MIRIQRRPSPLACRSSANSEHRSVHHARQLLRTRQHHLARNWHGPWDASRPGATGPNCRRPIDGKLDIHASNWSYGPSICDAGHRKYVSPFGQSRRLSVNCGHAARPRSRIAGLMARIWHATLELVWTITKAQVHDLGLLYGADDGNRTRALSLGIMGPRFAFAQLTSLRLLDGVSRYGCALSLVGLGVPLLLAR
jgi:hypothetical protein